MPACLGRRGLGRPCCAEDAYYNIPLDKLELTEGQLPKGEKEIDWRYWQLQQYMRPYVILDGGGEVYVQNLKPLFSSTPRSDEEYYDHIAVCIPAGRDVTGRLFLPKPDYTGYEMAKFKIPASAADKDAKNKFLQRK